MRPDKEKVIDEVWDEARIRSFLDKAPLGDEPADFSTLLYAYRSMRAEDFERFISYYLADGRDINARSAAGETLLGTIAGHRKGAPFRDILERHGAR